MKKVDLEQFMTDYYKDTDVVKVKAVELQRILREHRKLILRIASLERELEVKSALFDRYKKVQDKELPLVDLHI